MSRRIAGLVGWTYFWIITIEDKQTVPLKTEYIFRTCGYYLLGFLSMLVVGGVPESVESMMDFNVHTFEAS